MVRGGDVVKVERGTALLERARKAKLELRDGSEVEIAKEPELRSGDLLVRSGSRDETIEVAGARAGVAGIAHISRDLAVGVATYRGTTKVRSAGRDLAVSAFRQASIPAFGLVPASAVPLAYDENDTWDRRYLGVAMDLTDALQARSIGLSAQAPGSARELVGEVLPAAPPAALSSSRPLGETLVGAAIAFVGRRGTVTTRWDGLFGFRDEGAAWGLVALDQGVSESKAILGRLDALIRDTLLAAPSLRGIGASASARAPLLPSNGTSQTPEEPRQGPDTSLNPPPVTIPPPTTGTPLDTVITPAAGAVNGIVSSVTTLLPLLPPLPPAPLP